MATSLLGEEPRLGSTPLAMLAATCNKIGSPSPSPSSLSDSSSSFGKGFHPWKRSSSSSSASCNVVGSSLSSFGVSGASRNGSRRLQLALRQRLLCFPGPRSFRGQRRRRRGRRRRLLRALAGRLPPAGVHLQGAHLCGRAAGHLPAGGHGAPVRVVV
uniref:cDNA FLJ51541, moderately similar to Transcription factor Sp8 n=1 Tax=Homo sapiens TaxID=9606 RepID=B4DSW4_HUMAN|nr:unnamed protein product [Homo sapiens]